MSRLQGKLETDRYGGGAVVGGETIATAHEFISAELLWSDTKDPQRVVIVEVYWPEERDKPQVNITLAEELEATVGYM